MASVITIFLLSKRSSVRIARYALKAFLAVNDVPEDIAIDSEIALGEALSNVIIHTYRDFEGGRIIVSYLLKDDELRIVIRDFGPPVNKENLRPIPPDPENPRTGGYGLYIIRNLVDHWEVRNLKNGNLTVLVRKLR